MTSPSGPDLSPGDFRGTRMLPDFVSSVSTLGSEPASLETRLSPARRTPAAAGALASTPPKARSRKLFGLLAVGAALALVAALALSLRGGASEQRHEAPSAGSLAANSVQVSVLAKPDSARIVLDGRVLEGNSYAARHERDAREHTLEVSAPGYRPQQAAVHFDRDVTLQFHLSALEADAPAAERPVATPPMRVRPSAEPPTRRERVRGNTSRVESAVPERDPYVDLPTPRRAPTPAPELDRSDPWTSERR